MTAKELSQKTGLSLGTIRVYCCKGKIPYSKNKKEGVFFDDDEIDKWMSNRVFYTKKNLTISKTDEEWRVFYKNVFSLVKEGMNISDAVKKLGEKSTSAFYKNTSKSELRELKQLKCLNRGRKDRGLLFRTEILNFE